MRSFQFCLLLFTVFTLSALWGCDANKGGQANPNIVLITLDTVRADHVGCYGYFRNTTPTIDEFAKECILFERCVVPMATTLPTHASILTGTYPTEHGALSNTTLGGDRFVATPKLLSLAMVCGKEGYMTAAFVSAASLKRGCGIEEGFETFWQPEGPECPAGQTTDQALQWLSREVKKPYFLWVHYYDPHWPFSPPPPFRSMYRTDENLEEFIAQRQIPRNTVRPLVSLVEDARTSINLYDGEIRYMDGQIERLLESLRSREDWGSTAVLLMGDHGEGLCQHGEAAHGGTWNEQLYSPMMIRVPGQKARRIPYNVSAVDALPTLLGLLDTTGFESIMNQASGKNVLAPGFESTAVLSQDSGRKINEPNYRYSLTSERWKFFWTENPEGKRSSMLFDLQKDPHELNDVWALHREVADHMKSELLSRIEKQKKRGEILRKGVDTKAGAVDPAIVDQLKKLGYIDAENERDKE